MQLFIIWLYRTFLCPLLINSNPVIRTFYALLILCVIAADVQQNLILVYLYSMVLFSFNIFIFIFNFFSSFIQIFFFHSKISILHPIAKQAGNTAQQSNKLPNLNFFFWILSQTYSRSKNLSVKNFFLNSPKSLNHDVIIKSFLLPNYKMFDIKR